ncbi:MAG: oligopeptide transporter, OPT family [Bdellovibrionales bacterium]
MNQTNAPVELTPLSIGLGIVLGVIMTAANVYLGLYAGMTVSASIPAAVIAMGITRGVFKKSNVYESNIVQTMASAGESLAAGVIFTLPALVIVGAWSDFDFIQTTAIAIAGGLLGVIFMIPLRKALIIDDKDLTYPEGVACAAVLRSATETTDADSQKNIKAIVNGVGIGAIFKFLVSGVKLFTGEVAIATKLFGRVGFFGLDASPALLAVGYIVGVEVALMVFLGGAIGWVVGIPMLGIPTGMESKDALDIAWTLWSTQIRYLGVGAMVVGGLWSIFTVRSGIVSGLSGLKSAYKDKDAAAKIERENRDISLVSMSVIFMVCLAIMFTLYEYLIGSHALSLFTTLLMFVVSFLFVAVSSYIVGLVGSSNNPVSGMTISALLGTAAFFLVLGFKGESAILATLGVAAVVCCAACTAGDCSQDLKTGSIIKATPRNQQIAQIIGVLIPAIVIAPVLTLLHEAYVIGEGLKAPQATLFASITQALFGDGDLPYDMVGYGAILGVIVIAVDSYFKSIKSKVRLHLMPVAVGIYLPITLAVPMLVGGLIKRAISGPKDIDEAKDRGILLSSGIIAGEALMGVLVAVILYLNIDIAIGADLSMAVKEIVSLIAFISVAYVVHKVAKSAN